MKYLITGGCGFIGSNLAAEVLKRGEELIVFDNLFRHGSALNLNWLRKKGGFKYYPLDIRNLNDIETVIKEEKPDIVFHLAGQVAMTTSISNPRLDFEINALGTFNLLDSIRKYSPNTMVLYSSSNKVYGDFEELTFEETETRYECKEYPNGFDENLPLNFHSPYGCSKGAADQYLLDFYRIHNIKTVVFRHSSMYGGNQHSTIDQGWIGWFCQKALDIKNNIPNNEFTISGTGKQVRDVLHANDVVSLYFAAVDNVDKVKGKAFNIGGGITNSLSLLELFSFLEKKLNIKMNFIRLPERESDQLSFVANNDKISNLTGWKPLVKTEEGLGKMLNWLSK
uniref:NAD-dependent epimerase/dehydratase family protein n=1 Tax=uncultured Polaribacter sp. TaxID=174711 RepID=UPI0026083B12|nr:NAD-dependent epimerase/dehydratase family protein [uncultured Polaribacter sp.]